ncbi:unannotated protein [freshwater metagenome]|uniref:Unannotated protein n=1 Tax=freshwater metagenome TaxID=449393 RepID=A0A6J6C213_9ZZZZ
MHHHLAIGSEVDIEFDPIGPLRHRSSKGAERVAWRIRC